MTFVLQTRYDGCHFRSRLEARWAVFFNTLGIAWEYEPEVYEVQFDEGPSVRYLPDFLLPKIGCFVEVKGSLDGLQAAADNLEAILDFNSPLPGVTDSHGTTRGLLLLGPIPRATGGRAIHWLYQHRKGVIASLAQFTDDGRLEIACLGFEHGFRCINHTDLSPHLGGPYNYEWAHGAEAAALTAASSARFDSGRPARTGGR